MAENKREKECLNFLGRPFKLGEGELALLRKLHMLDREELGKANRCFSLGTLLACGDLGGETRVSRRWRWEERWQGRLKAVSIVCRLGIDMPATPEAGDGEASSILQLGSLSIPEHQSEPEFS